MVWISGYPSAVERITRFAPGFNHVVRVIWAAGGPINSFTNNKYKT
jgi:hypothetical protein